MAGILSKFLIRAEILPRDSYRSNLKKTLHSKGYMGRISERQETAILLEFLCYDQLNSLKSFLPLPYLMCSGGEG